MIMRVDLGMGTGVGRGVGMRMPPSLTRVRRDGLAGGGGHELAMFDALGAEQGIGNGTDPRTGASQDHHLQAVAAVEVDVNRRHNFVDELVLDSVQFVGKVGRVMIEHHGDGARDLGIRPFHRILHQRIPHQVTHRLGPVSPGATASDQGIETGQEIRLHGDAEPHQLIHGLDLAKAPQPPGMEPPAAQPRAATGILPIRARHSAGPVWWTEPPRLSTATVTGISTTSNSRIASMPKSSKAMRREPLMALATR